MKSLVRRLPTGFSTAWIRIPARASQLAAFFLPALVSCGLVVPSPADSQDVMGRFPSIPGIYTQAVAGDTLLIGGGFNDLFSYSKGVVVVDTATNEPDYSWEYAGGPVWTIAPDRQGGWYIGGEFVDFAGVPRMRLAHVRSDKSLSGWDPVAYGRVTKLVATRTTVMVSGLFNRIGDEPRSGLAAINAVSGGVLAWTIGVTGSLLAASDSLVIFQDYAGPNGTGRLAAVDPETGAIRWFLDLEGGIAAAVFEGDTLYLGGTFSSIGGIGRSNLAAIDGRTGELLAWAPSVNAGVSVMAIEGSTAYVGGAFTLANGEGRGRLAAFDGRTATLLGWNPNADGTVLAIAATSTTVYLFGTYTSLGGASCRPFALVDAKTGAMCDRQTAMSPSSLGHLVRVRGTVVGVGGFQVLSSPRKRIAAIEGRSGKLLPLSLQINGVVNHIAVWRSTAYIAGSFTLINGVPRTHVASFNLRTGELLPWAPVLNGEVDAIVADDSTVYLGGAFTEVAGSVQPYLAAVDANAGALREWRPEVNRQVGVLALVDTVVIAASAIDVPDGQGWFHLGRFSTKTGEPLFCGDIQGALVTHMLASGDTVYLGGYLPGMLMALDARTGQIISWGNNFTCWNVSGLGFCGPSLIVGCRNTFGAFDPATGDPLGVCANGVPGGESMVSDGAAIYLAGVFGGTVGGQPNAGLARMTNLVGPCGLQAHVEYPAGGEVLIAGDTIDVSWAAAGGMGGVRSVDLYLDRNDPMRGWELIAAGVANHGSYRWVVTRPLVSSGARLRVDARDWSGAVASATSPGSFAIGMAGVGVTSPVELSEVVFSLRGGNPSAGYAWADVTLPANASAKLSVFDAQGRRIEGVASTEVIRPGRQVVQLDLARAPSGLYFVALDSSVGRFVRRMVMLR